MSFWHPAVHNSPPVNQKGTITIIELSPLYILTLCFYLQIDHHGMYKFMALG